MSFNIDTTAERARSVIGVDIDRDGDIDAVSGSVLDDTIAWYENDGSGNFSMRPIDQRANGAYGVSAVDIDFDGDVDVLATSKNNPGIVALHTQQRTITATVTMSGVLVIDAEILRTVDANDGPGQLTYTLTEIPTQGDIRVGGILLAAGDTFTQSQINSGDVSYAHGGGNKPGDEFTFTVADGGEDGVQPATGIFTIVVNNSQR